ncbi:MAG: Ig-like domain-containing protein [Candidatus Kariarchaeaceae archaeon]|jgi:YVTN family beta-propeller protein
MDKTIRKKEVIISVVLGLLLFVGCEDKEWPTDPPDLTRPEVTSTNPEDGSIMNPVSESITVTFTEAMNLSSVSALTTVTDGNDNTISGSWSGSGKTYTFTPQSALSNITLYNVTMKGAFTPEGEWIGAGVRDDNGNSLKDETSFSFSTEGNYGNSPIYLGSGNYNPGILAYVQNFEVSELEDYPGEGMQSLAMHPAGTYVYSASRDNSILIVVEVTSNTVSAEISMPDGVEEPRALAVTPDGSEVLVACVGSMDLVVINTADNSISATISLADYAGDINYMTVNNAGTRAYITTSWDQGVIIVDLQSRTVLEYLDGISEDNAMAIAVSADDSKIFLFVAWVEEEIVIIDANNTANTRTMTLGSGGDGWKVSVEEDFIYACGRWNGNIYKINMTDESYIENNVDWDLRGIAVDTDGEVVYSLSPGYNDEGGILILNASDLSLLGAIPAGNYRDMVTP